jgi:ribonucleoside-diphosphate reductase beta chain
MSILNRQNVNTLSQPLFLGEPLSLQRYDRLKYPIFVDLFNKQFNFIWRPEEINVSLDRGQFKELQQHEQFIFTKNLLFQTMLDSVVSRGVPTFTKHVSNPELELCMGIWSFFENVHSYSYSYIIQNVYSNPTEILDEALTNPEIAKRADSVTKAYEDLEKETLNLKEKIYLSLISVNILEAVRFYVSFVCAFAFGENKKMIGNSDIIKLIRRDEAVHLYVTQTIINLLRTKEEEGFVDTIKRLQPEAIEMFMKAAEEEKNWASYLFQHGSILGLNERVLHQYIEWLVDSRMKELGLPKQFGAKNPIGGWIEPWMNSSSVQVAPQETEITSYKIGASKNDLNELDLGGLL